MVKELGVINRQLRLLRILASRRRGVTAEELKDELEVSLKTIRRDLDRLSNAGFPLDMTPNTGAGGGRSVVIRSPVPHSDSTKHSR